MIVVGLLASVLVPLLGRAGLLTNYSALLIGSAVAMAAAGLSLNMLMGYAGQLSLGQYSLLGVGAFASGAITPATRHGLPFLIAIPAAALAGAGVAFLVGLPALRLRGLYLAVVTIAFSFAMTESIFRAESIGGGSAGIVLPRPQVNDFIFTRNADYLGVLLALLAGIWWFDTNVTRTKIGRAFRAIRQDESVAASFGVDVTRYKLGAFALAGAMAGIAGLMSGHLVGTVNSESFTYEKSLVLVVVVVVGGLGSRVGVLAAAAFYAIYPIAAPKIFGDGVLGYDQVVGAAVLILTLTRNPTGMAGAVRERIEQRRASRSVHEVVAADAAGAPAAMPKLPVLPRPAALPPRPQVDGPVLACEDVRVRFGGLLAVDDASIVVPRGRVVGLIGPNGAGKTTLFNVLSGLQKPDGGRVHLLGQDVTHVGAAGRAALGVGRTFQNIGLVKDLSVTENLLLAQHTIAGYGAPAALGYAGNVGSSERLLRERADTAIEALGFARYADTPISQLSIGQQRIVELGAVLVTAPEVVMLDEPSAGMSPAAAENLAERLARSARRTRTHRAADRAQHPPCARHVRRGVRDDRGRDRGPRRAIGCGARPRRRRRLPRGVGPVNTPLLEASGIDTGFGVAQVLFDVNVTVGEGEIAGVFGLNGAGKSVFMKVLSGLLPPWAGTVRLRGEDITKMAPEQRVALGMGHVPQGRQVFPDLTVEENLRLGAYTLRRRDKSRYAPSLATVWERFPKLYERRRQAAGTMSGGEQAALAVGRALVNEPSILLVDEPSAGLAPLIVADVFASLRAVAESGVTMLLVEQNVAAALQLVDSVTILQTGSVAWSGPVGQLDRSMLAARLGIGRLLSAGTTKALKKRTAPKKKKAAPAKKKAAPAKKKAAPAKKKAAPRK